MSIRLISAVTCSLALAGCAGLRMPTELPDTLQAPRHVALQLQAASRLNVSASGQSLSLVARIYKLRQKAAFENAPFTAFLDPASERRALGADLIEAREVTLVPGQQLADMLALQLMDIVPLRFKVGSPEDVDKFVLSAMPGVRLVHAPQVPAAIPVRPAALYFVLDSKGALYDSMLKAQAISIFVPNEIRDLKLELMASAA